MYCPIQNSKEASTHKTKLNKKNVRPRHLLLSFFISNLMLLNRFCLLSKVFWMCNNQNNVLSHTKLKRSLHSQNQAEQEKRETTSPPIKLLYIQFDAFEPFLLALKSVLDVQ